jgi:hypothetical protein
MLYRPNPPSRQTSIRAELSGDDTAAVFEIKAYAFAPVLALCRALIEAGYDHSRPLEAYRGETLCLRIRSIGEAAGLELGSDGVGFKCRCEPGAAPPIENSAPPPVGQSLPVRRAL